MLHFGYSSNLNLGFLRQYCPSARFVMRAYLPNYEVQFRFWSKRRQGASAPSSRSRGPWSTASYTRSRRRN